MNSHNRKATLGEEITKDWYKSKLSKLKTQLNNTKIFLNMVIHDMRNPTNSIEFAIKEIMKIMKIEVNGKMKNHTTGFKEQ